MVKQAVEAYGEYEQLVGGVETLFGDAAKIVQENAANAFKTAGMSANDYMNTTIALSASLVQSLGGDTAKAAEIADLAITDMSDNINKMGTSAEMVQNAYRGFVRQNFTMLDNLALGYGGTKEEMTRLLADAEKISGIKYDISSLADMIQAIHVVQTEMNITGTTAKEAATTIQGSVNSMKAAWQNLIVGVADDNQDFDKLMDEFVDSVEIAGDNVLPRVEKALDGVATLVEKGADKLLPKAIAVVMRNLPKFIDAGGKIVTAVGDGMVKNSPEILKAGRKALTNLTKSANIATREVLRELKRQSPQIITEIKSIAKEVDGTIVAIAGVGGAVKALAKGDYVGAAIGGIVAVIGLVKKSCDNAKQAVKGLSDEEELYLQKADAAADSLRSLLDTRNQNVNSIEIETRETRKLWGELQTLVDEQGKVKDGSQSRAEYILGELNKALGTEYTMNDGIIGQYQQMQTEIDKLILKRRAERLLESGAEAYDEAKTNMADYAAQAELAAEALANAQRAHQKILDEYERGEGAWHAARAKNARAAIAEAQEEYDRLKKNAAAAASTIQAYEDAMRASSEQNYEQVAKILEKNSAYRWEHMSDITKISDEEAEQLQNDWKNAERAATFYRKQYDEGIAGFTAETAEDLEKKAHSLKNLIEQYSQLSTTVSTATAAGSALSTTSTSGIDKSTIKEAFSEALQGVVIRLDSGALVGGIAPKMDNALGNRYRASNREVLVN